MEETEQEKINQVVKALRCGRSITLEQIQIRTAEVFGEEAAEDVRLLDKISSDLGLHIVEDKRQRTNLGL